MDTDIGHPKHRELNGHIHVLIHGSIFYNLVQPHTRFMHIHKYTLPLQFYARVQQAPMSHVSVNIAKERNAMQLTFPNISYVNDKYLLAEGFPN